MTVRIITDSTADVPSEWADQLGITIVPMGIQVEGQLFEDGVTLDRNELYEKMSKQGMLPTTTGPSPQTFCQRMDSLLQKGFEVLYVGLSSKLSATFQTAKIASTMTEDSEHVHLYDSQTTSFALGQLVLHAAELALEGAEIPAIIDQLRRLRDRSRFFFSIDTLDNLRRSGRVNSVMAMISGLLNIKPILSLTTSGDVTVAERARGRKGVFNSLKQLLTNHPPDPSYWLGIGHVNNQSTAEEVKQLLQDIGFTKLVLFDVSPVLGIHAGEGAWGVFYTEAPA